ncbi:hypothetical protein DY000_02049887 [Brassica cretica]|uniref:Uncharacterized protein n=1 Tax=Brassica cretica TaxID=69181 RepID=A0ABQ7EZ29_BRACR|nr:hypothetical protein DY000_02049887 [Brassica cretica]
MLVFSLQCPRMCVRNLQLIFSGILKMLKPHAAKRFNFTCKMLASNALVNSFFPPLLKDNCTFIVPNSFAYN